MWDTFKIGIATPVDFGTRFRMIIGDLGTRSKLGEAGGCRLGCGCAQEKHIHLLRCPVIKPIWNKLITILQTLRGKPFRQKEQAILFGWTTDDKTIEKGSTALFSMLLKIIVIEWTAVWRLGIQFDPDKVWRIFWSRAKRQWEETKADKEAEFRNIRQRESCTKSTRIGIARQIAPIGTIDITGKITCQLNWKRYE